MAPELNENHGKITLDTIRWLYRRNSRVTLYKLVQKTRLADTGWVFRYLNTVVRRYIFQYIQLFPRDLLLLHLLISFVSPAIFSLREAPSRVK